MGIGTLRRYHAARHAVPAPAPEVQAEQPEVKPEPKAPVEKTSKKKSAE